MIVHLLVGLIKKTLYKHGNTFQINLKTLEEILMFKLICLIMQQKLILKM